MKDYLSVGMVVILLLSLVIIMLGCAPSEDGITGTYVSENKPNVYIEIKKDGNFSFYEMRSKIYYGKWQDGKTITFRVPTGVYFVEKLRIVLYI